MTRTCRLHMTLASTDRSACWRAALLSKAVLQLGSSERGLILTRLMTAPPLTNVFLSCYTDSRYTAHFIVAK